MSLPRLIVPGRIYMITRRCSERRFFLRPDPETNNAFVYCLALAAQTYGVKVIFTATRPKAFFRPDGATPPAVSLQLFVPPELTPDSRAEFVARLQERIAAAEQSAAASRKESGRRILRRAVVRAQHWNDRPNSRE